MSVCFGSKGVGFIKEVGDPATMHLEPIVCNSE